MRKFTSLLAFVCLAGFAIGQVSQTSVIEAKAKAKTSSEFDGERTIIRSQSKADPAWQMTFDEGTEDWTFGTLLEDGTSLPWQVTDSVTLRQISTPEGMMSPVYWYSDYVKNYSESGGNMAIITPIDILIGALTPFELVNNYIQFDGIDLTDVTSPELSFIQVYRAFNSDSTYIDYSIDGGTTWTAKSIDVNAVIATNSYGPLDVIILMPEIANEANVSIRFRFSALDDDAQYGSGYAWSIDDIVLRQAPAYDISYVHGVTNFFEYADYTDVSQVDYFHFSSHYGNIPQIQFAAEASYCAFNIVAKNTGINTITPTINVQILDPQGAEVYNQTVTGSTLASNVADTFDIIGDNELFTPGGDLASGLYTIVYNTGIEGQDDLVIENNSDTSYFRINGNEANLEEAKYFSRVIDTTSINAATGNPRFSSTGVGNWNSGGMDGEMIATSFLFNFETEIKNIEVFLAGGEGEDSPTGAGIVGHVLQFDNVSNEWITIASTDLLTIEDANHDKWVTLNFTDPAFVTFGDGETSRTIRAAIEFYYNGVAPGNVQIGYERQANASIWGHSIMFLTGTSAGSFIALSNWAEGGLAIKLNMRDGSEIPGNIENGVFTSLNIYPNPTNGVLNIEGLENASIEIINMMGQVVESINTTDFHNSVDMSKYANGTYFARIIKDNKVETRKINLVK